MRCVGATSPYLQDLIKTDLRVARARRRILNRQLAQDRPSRCTVVEDVVPRRHRRVACVVDPVAADHKVNIRALAVPGKAGVVVTDLFKRSTSGGPVLEARNDPPLVVVGQPLPVQVQVGVLVPAVEA